ncbi:MAG: SAM-dependent methyltransferase [Oscillatoriaceae cyanobacterium Prado104]|jgi:hypothetical protein|nr:SAM-dependent methyltransferase [Oscillatoriaceae cyanobacterium Prado104]
MRHPNDFYPTPKLLTKQLIDRIPIHLSDSIFEPCAGDGAIVHFLQQLGYSIEGNDIDPQFGWNYDLGDATKDMWVSLRTRPDWVITNPPFDRAHLILPLAYECATVGVAFLLRLTYLEPAGNRGEWLRSQSPNFSNLIIFGQPRPSFTNNGKVDSCTVAWMVWRKHWADGCQVDFVFDWK